MNSVFNEQILADKLSKLNSTQQCIETLSHWCIFHRKKAALVVETWDKQFRSSDKEKKVPFLYLANDILQNSRRKGTEFVTEFWKVLPIALKDVVENGDENGKSAASRLVAIWEERKVFGSRARGLQDIMLGREPPPPLELNRKRSRSVRIVKRDSRSIRIKMALGGTPEKIVSAFHSVLSDHPSEDADLSKCKSAVHRVRKMEKDVDRACTRVGHPERAALASELEEEETLLKECIGKLKSVETTREALVSQLREALREQESQLENVRTQLQVAQGRVEEASNMRRRLNDPSFSNPTDSNASGETPKRTAAAIAAEVADKLAASTYSQQIMTSVLSTFAAEEAKNTRPNLENPMQVSAAPHQPQTVLVHQQPMQSQISTTQPQYALLTTLPAQQFIQPSGGMLVGLPYGYSSLPPPPPPPPLPPPHVMNLARPAPLPMQQQSAPLIMQQPVPPSFRPLQTPSMAFYTHPH